MQKITLHIEGMACGMCEAHMNDAIRQAFSVKKVTSSHKSKETVILTKEEPDDEKLQAVVAKAGYTLCGIDREPYEKKGFFCAFKK